MRVACVAAGAVILHLAAPAPALAGGTIVLVPAADRSVKNRYHQRLVDSVASRVDEAEVSMADESAWGARERSACAQDAKCLAEVGAEAGAARTVGISVAAESDGRFSMTMVLVDVAAGKELARATESIAKKELKRSPGPKLVGFLAAAPPAEDPEADSSPESLVEEENAEVDAAMDAAVPESSASRVLGAPSVEGAAENAWEDSDKRWAVSISGGSLISRGGLGAGPVVGAEVSYRPLVKLPLRLHAAFDWAYLAEQSNAIVGPPDYPRGRLDLTQNSSLWSIVGGATYDLLRRESFSLNAGASLGVSISRSTFDAASMSLAENDASVLFEPRVGGRGPLGPAFWRVDLGWRQSNHDLGASGDFGEDQVSALIVRAGIGLEL